MRGQLKTALQTSFPIAIILLFPNAGHSIVRFIDGVSGTYVADGPGSTTRVIPFTITGSFTYPESSCPGGNCSLSDVSVVFSQVGNPLTVSFNAGSVVGGTQLQFFRSPQTSPPSNLNLLFTGDLGDPSPSAIVDFTSGSIATVCTTYQDNGNERCRQFGTASFVPNGGLLPVPVALGPVALLPLASLFSLRKRYKV